MSKHIETQNETRANHVVVDQIKGPYRCTFIFQLTIFQRMHFNTSQLIFSISAQREHQHAGKVHSIISACVDATCMLIKLANALFNWFLVTQN